MDAMTRAEERSPIQLGEFRFDLDRQCLRKDHKSQPLDPKEFSVLLQLAEAAPLTVDTQALLERCWPGVVVGDNVIHQVIARLRRYLNDDARSPQYIENLPKRGYRLLTTPTPVVETADHTTQKQLAGRSRWRLFAGVAGLALTVIIATAGVTYLTATTPEVEHGIEAGVPETSVIAVATLRDLSPNADLGWLSFGLTEEIRREISNWQRYKILHRSSSQVGTAELSDIPADLLLDGYLQPNRGSVAVVLSLIDLPSGKTRWQEEFVGDPEDPLAMQSRVAANVANYFNARYVLATEAKTNTVEFETPRHPKAYQAYLKGLHSNVNGDASKEIYWVEKALALEPQWTEGWRRLVMNNGVVYHVTGQYKYAQRATEAMAMLDRGGENTFHEIFYTAYVEDDFVQAEKLARDWVAASNHPYAIYAYARLMQESGLHREAATAFAHFSEEQSADPAGWEGTYINRLLISDFVGAKQAAERHEQLIPLEVGAAANRALLMTAAVSGDIGLATELLAKRDAQEALLEPGSYRWKAMRTSSNAARFLLAVAKGDFEAAKTQLPSWIDAGAHLGAALAYLRLGDERAAAEQFAIVKKREHAPGLFLWAYNKILLEPSQFQHPLVLDYEAHMGIGQQWREELCVNAARMPPETHLDCDLAGLIVMTQSKGSHSNDSE